MTLLLDLFMRLNGESAAILSRWEMFNRLKKNPIKRSEKVLMYVLPALTSFYISYKNILKASGTLEIHKNVTYESMIAKWIKHISI